MAIDRLEEQMLAAAGSLDFEKAARLRRRDAGLKAKSRMASAEQARRSRADKHQTPPGQEKQTTKGFKFHGTI